MVTTKLALQLVAVFACFLPFLDANYDDQWTRKLLSMSAAGFASDPKICVQKEFSNNDWTFLRKETVLDHKRRLNVSVFAIENSAKKEIVISYAVFEPTDEEKLESLFKYAEPVSFHGYGQVQSIFYELEELVWSFTQSIVAFADYQDHTVTFTGYSLGGGVATLSAMKSIFKEFKHSSNVQLVTFGEPRVGTLVFSSSVDREIPQKFRVTHGGDPVVHLPRCIMRGESCTINEPMSPTHHGTEIFYNNTMYFSADFIRCTAKDEDEKCSLSRAKSLNFEDHVYYFEHKVINYGRFDCTDVEGTQPNSGQPVFVNILSCLLSIAFLMTFL